MRVKLSDFLLARLAEDEEVATELQAWQYSGASSGMDCLTSAEVSHIEHFDADRMLAECEAKRRIVGRAREAIRLSDETPDDDSPRSERIHGYAQALEEVCEQLVRPYADHPDLDPEWIA